MWMHRSRPRFAGFGRVVSWPTLADRDEPRVTLHPQSSSYNAHNQETSMNRTSMSLCTVVLSAGFSALAEAQVPATAAALPAGSALVARYASAIGAPALLKSQAITTRGSLVPARRWWRSRSKATRARPYARPSW